MKQVIIVRTDLKMGKGKIAAQVAHAAVSASNKAQWLKPEWFKQWIELGQKKIVIRTDSLELLLSKEEHARVLDIPVVLIKDQGLTQLPQGTVTALGIGPAPENDLDKITKEMKLL
ncbi:MAG: peptidyl-tRNA hydrolase Pth2 [Candidatus Heimdallarchaeota archaeon]